MIRRAPRDGGFTTLENETLEDDALSWEATGLLVFLLSKPDNWEVRVQHLINCRDAGRHKIKRILSELEDAGYLVRHRVQDDEGKFDWESVIFETPKDDDSSIPRKSVDGSSVDGSPVDGKPVDITKTEGSDNGSNNEGGSSSNSARARVTSCTEESVDAITEAAFGQPLIASIKKEAISARCREYGQDGWDALRAVCIVVAEKGWNPTAPLILKKLTTQLELIKETNGQAEPDDFDAKAKRIWEAAGRGAGVDGF